MGRILMVDDDPDILKLSEAVLSDAGHSVISANDALHALELLNQMEFDMVISDANMPGYSGFDLVATIRKNPKLKELAVAMLTGRRERRDIERALQSGVDDYIVKPIDPMILQQKVAALFEKRPPREYPSIKLDAELGRGHLQMNVAVESVSEFGVIVTTDVALPTGAVVAIEAEFFREIDVEPPPLKVLVSEADLTPGRYRAQLVFLGARETLLRKIRAWMYSHGGSRRAP